MTIEDMATQFPYNLNIQDTLGTLAASFATREEALVISERGTPTSRISEELTHTNSCQPGRNLWS